MPPVLNRTRREGRDEKSSAALLRADVVHGTGARGVWWWFSDRFFIWFSRHFNGHRQWNHAQGDFAADRSGGTELQRECPGERRDRRYRRLQRPEQAPLGHFQYGDGFAAGN